MRIEKLQEGQIFKNYKTVCKELEIPTKTGKAKQLQMKEIERYCKYEKIGHSISIVEVYSTPKKKIDNRGKDNIYGELLKLIFMDVFINSGQPELILTKNNLLEGANLMNTNYRRGQIQTKRVSEIMNISKEVVDDFYNTSKGNFKYMIESTLSALRKRSVIMYTKVVMVCDNGNQHREASPEEKATILSQEASVMEKMDCEDLHQVIASGQWDKYRFKVQQQLKDYRIKYYYSAYNITINMDYIESKHNTLLLEVADEIKNSVRKTEANSLICEKLLQNSISRKNNSTFSSKLHEIRSEFNYAKDNSKLIELLIKENPSIQLEEEFKK